MRDGGDKEGRRASNALHMWNPSTLVGIQSLDNKVPVGALNLFQRYALIARELPDNYTGGSCLAG